VQVKNVQAQRIVQPVKIANTVNTVLKMVEVVRYVNNKNRETENWNKE
jgi:hypothetical protein